MKRVIILLIIASTISFSSSAQNSTIYFYRLKSLFLANTNCEISVKDTKFNLTNGSYYKLETSDDSIAFQTTLSNNGLKGLKLKKGETYYIQAEIATPNSVNLKLQTEFSGKPAIERIEAESKSPSSENLPKEKVTKVEPLPYENAEKAVIYLFRPFNVTGVSIIAQVSDGNKIYELKNNSSTVLVYDKGEITLRTVNEGKNTSNTSLKLNLEQGKVYYVAVLRSGGALVLTETKAEYAKKEMKLE